MTNIWEIEKMMGLKKLESRHYTGEFFLVKDFTHT